MWDTVINDGKDKKDTKTYKKDQFYFFKLPVTEGYTKDTFVIEDYFSNESRKRIALSKLDEVVGFNDIPKDLKKSVKDDLAKKIESYTKEDMEGFKVLLDKIHNIITDNESITELWNKSLLIQISKKNHKNDHTGVNQHSSVVILFVSSVGKLHLKINFCFR